MNLRDTCVCVCVWKNEDCLHLNFWLNSKKNNQIETKKTKCSDLIDRFQSIIDWFFFFFFWCCHLRHSYLCETKKQIIIKYQSWKKKMKHPNIWILINECVTNFVVAVVVVYEKKNSEKITIFLAGNFPCEWMMQRKRKMMMMMIFFKHLSPRKKSFNLDWFFFALNTNRLILLKYDKNKIICRFIQGKKNDK